VTLGGNKYLMQNAIGNYVLASAAAISGLFRGFLIKRYLYRK
jgi:hypothetical protein